MYQSKETAQSPGQGTIDYAGLTNTFKVSHLTRPTTYKASQRLLNLQKPKSVGLKTRRKQNVYDRSDFRGLLYADYKETIDSVFTKGTEKIIAEAQAETQAAHGAPDTQAIAIEDNEQSHGLESVNPFKTD